MSITPYHHEHNSRPPKKKSFKGKKTHGKHYSDSKIKPNLELTEPLMNPQVTDMAGGYEPAAAAADPRRRRRPQGPHTQLAKNQQALFREPSREDARVWRIREGGTAMRAAARSLRPQVEGSVAVLRLAGVESDKRRCC